MKKFIKNVIIYTCILLVIMITVIYLSHLDGWREYFNRITDSGGYIESFVNGSDEIKPFIQKVQERDENEILILGDSICHQMFEDLIGFNEDITMAGSNAAITMAGQYILAKEYLENHENAKEIYLMVHPTSLKRTFDTVYGYQYIIMPFSETDTLKALDEDTIAICKEVYGSVFLKPDIVYMINKSGMNRKLYLNLLKTYGTNYEEKVSFEMADKYISKIYELCKEHNVKLHFLATPVSEVLDGTCEELEKEYQNTWMKQYYPEYFENIIFVPAEQVQDGFHFSGEYKNQEYYNELLKKIFGNTELINKIRFF